MVAQPISSDVNAFDYGSWVFDEAKEKELWSERFGLKSTRTISNIQMSSPVRF